MVSIILPTYNNGEDIGNCLDSLIHQTYRKFEIIVIDDGSTDNTEKIVKEYPVKYFKIKHSGRAHAKNIGAKMALGNILAFVEADGVYPSRYIESIVPHFIRDPEVGGVSTPYRVLNKTNFVTSCKDIERQVNFSDDYKPFGASIYRRSVFEEIGGFDESLEFGEDIDPFPRLIALGYKVSFEPQALWYHKSPTSIISLLADRFNRGKGILKYNIKHKLPLMPYRSITLLLILIILAFFSALNHRFLMLMLALLIYSFVGGVRLKRIKWLRKALKITQDHAHSIGWFFIGWLDYWAYIFGTIVGFFNFYFKSLLQKP